MAPAQGHNQTFVAVRVDIYRYLKGKDIFVFNELFLTMIQVGPVLVSEEKIVAKLAFV